MQCMLLLPKISILGRACRGGKVRKGSLREILGRLGARYLFSFLAFYIN